MKDKKSIIIIVAMVILAIAFFVWYYFNHIKTVNPNAAVLQLTPAAPGQVPTVVATSVNLNPSYTELMAMTDADKITVYKAHPPGWQPVGYNAPMYETIVTTTPTAAK